jgi:uncharacterized membrane protein YdjX (TVP38/TMEM64 family)
VRKNHGHHDRQQRIRCAVPRRHVIRLAALCGFLLVLFYLLAVRHVVDVEALRRTVSATGPAAPLTYVVVSAVLGAAFVPGPVLAASSGVLFGPRIGRHRWRTRRSRCGA